LNAYYNEFAGNGRFEETSQKGRVDFESINALRFAKKPMRNEVPHILSSIYFFKKTKKNFQFLFLIIWDFVGFGR
jgi:hypothetical protein